MATHEINSHWIEISASALKHNLRIIHRVIPRKTQVMAMVKANAYGHGLELIAPLLSSQVDYFGVNTLIEALAIRRLGITTPVLITSPVSLTEIPLAVKNRFSVCVPSLEYLQSIQRFPLPVHLKINTGMNRLGLSLIDLLSALDIIRRSRLRLEGIYTHLHSADSNRYLTLSQLDAFSQAVYQTRYYFPRVLAHAANSAALFRYPGSYFDLVRPGLAVYGLYPRSGLKPVLSWKCHPVQTRVISPSDVVGYSATYSPSVTTLMSVLPVGYSDGLDRHLENRGRIYCRGKFFPIIGRISMNFTAVATGKTPLTGHDIVELIGPHITATTIAGMLDTINYEVVSRLNSAIPRTLV